MENLSLKESRLIAKNRNISGYKSMPKNKLLRIISNNNNYLHGYFCCEIFSITGTFLTKWYFCCKPYGTFFA